MSKIPNLWKWMMKCKSSNSSKLLWKWMWIILLFIFIICVIAFFVKSIYHRCRENYENANENQKAKVCFITAIYGNYETECRPFKTQTIPTDFICFTDNSNIKSNGWTIDTNPYHFTNPSPLDNKTMVNSLQNNRHNFNIAKYYKQAFRNIPILQKYEVVIWVDGSIQIVNENTSKIIYEKIHTHKIIGWEHEHRGGKLIKEVDASKNFHRYSSSFWNNQPQPVQDVVKQYDFYLKDGYDENYHNNPKKPNLGVWVTCFVAFLNNDDEVNEFLDTWYLQTLTFTTQDQIGFSYVCQKLKMIPYTLPDEEIKGDAPHSKTDFYIKHEHGAK